ncbi:FAD-binding oxidoreductase [Pedobacter changchengzhani]|uniref:D-lactate dehydrogenase (cytochrome) n=1 Tax=Pedobacter changchengzhani TaxID=2529274 RepID=A0A4R5MLE1_9SPHI|nr:FAD-binding and (Fe-S)-binding domain-containing protein [Pedobacter changchengzhani]TDG36520.1 FAD-binding oxidoreductase [Pedobacter changchengzhani]
MNNLADLLTTILPRDRIKSRLIDLVAFASDAGFYYLRPKAVVQPISTDEVQALFKFSHTHNIPITFRAAGTSLSGQSISDGILVDLSQYWNFVRVEDKGETVRVQPGVIGAIVNSELKRYGKKIGPDPASINAAMMGGIISNNASGMCCGVTKNSYHTIKYIKFVLPNGFIFSTEVAEDYVRFEAELPEIFTEIKLLREKILTDPSIYELIRHKYKTKNTVGYSVNAFIDYEHPLDILAHILVGGEGTLGFIAEAVLKTVPDYPLKTTSLLYFPDIFAACKAIVPLTLSGAEAVELMDRASLRSVENIKGVPDVLKVLPENTAALLVEYQGNTQQEIDTKANQFLKVSTDLNLLYPAVFTNDPTEQAFLWKIRKGMFPSVGAVRASGTTVILEDIAVPVSELGNAISDLQSLFRAYEYENAIIFGHAKDGNIHFVVTQAFETHEEISRYDNFLRAVVALVVDKYKGALKAEHGTGRNMSPFVATEWGSGVYEIMKALKDLIDPLNLLNPGVIINADKQAHIHHLKELPKVEEEVDKCMECGFCEHKCPSRNITLTPRQRIVVRRELLKLKDNNEKADYKNLLNDYQYDGLDTCAVDGLCATACPVDINTGSLVKRLRRENHNAFSNKVALMVAKNFKSVTWFVHSVINIANGINNVFGARAMINLTRGLKKIIPAVPLWSNQIKPTKYFSQYLNKTYLHPVPGVVYYPTCINRVMGGSAFGSKNIIDTFISVSEKTGVDFIIPNDIQGTCCGQIYSSKGFSDAYKFSVNDTVSKLWTWTKEGKLPVVLDISSCTHTLKDCRPALSDENKLKYDAIKIIDSVDYILEYLLPVAKILNKKHSIVLHPVCSLEKMGTENKFLKIAQQLAINVTVPIHAGCCGMAGDRGFLFPELTESATKPEADEVKSGSYEGYYSSAKTCEIAMSDAVGKNYESILLLLDECM